MKLKSIHITLIAFTILAACEDRTVETKGFEPYFNAVFINNDSLKQLQDSLVLISSTITNIDDSVDVIETRIAGGDETDYSNNLASLAEQKAMHLENRSVINKVIVNIKAGKVQIITLSAENNAAEVYYNDSLSRYKLPLNTYADESNYNITLGNKTYALNTVYSRETINQLGAVTVAAYDFNITSHSFDSLTIQQKDTINYRSNAATVTLYF